MPIRPLLALLVFCAANVASLSVTSPRSGSLEGRVVRSPIVDDGTVETSDPSARTAAIERFRHMEGGRWWGRLVDGSERASLISGSGLPIMPGRGNTLSTGDIVDLAELERKVRALVERHPGLLAPRTGRLRLSAARSAILREGALAYVDFDLEVSGYPVLGARVFARINSGNVIQLGTDLVGGLPDAVDPLLTAEQAADRMFEHAGGRSEVDRIHGEPQLYLLPQRQQGELRYLLVYEIGFKRGDEPATWTARIDARTGQVVEFFDASRYGQVTGGVFPRTVTDPEIVVGLPFVQVDGAGVTDRSGSFAYAGGEIRTGLDGQFFNTFCDGCSNPSQASSTTDLGLGWLRLGTGGTDQIGNGLSTRAERTAFFHLNLIRELAKKWIAIPWLDNNIRINANVAATCNAVYDGAVNLYRSGGGCNNTGEIADVAYHEWGHGIDGNTLGGDSATGEGTGDTVSLAFTHSPLVGPGFQVGGGAVRNLDRLTDPKGLLTDSNVTQKCGTGPCLGPQGRECHCEGEIYGQASWDLAQALVAKHGFHTGWQEHERIFFSSLPQAGTYRPNQASSLYDAYVAADDDDGNLNNGTPNGQEISDVFDLHEIRSNGSPIGSSSGCSRPEQPVISIGTGCDGITLSWAAVPGAAEYRVLRNPVSAASAFLPIATTAGTTYVDGEVLPDQSYHYAVEAVSATGCPSTIENVVTVSGPARPIVGLSAIVFDDIPMGNRSGTIDPGEAVDLTLTLENFTATDAGALFGTIASSTPGITIDVANRSFPDIAGLASVTNPETFRVSIDPSVACGSGAEFQLTVTDDSGCTAQTQFFRLQVGVDAIRQQDTFSSDLGWSFDAGSSTATLGDWVRGVPELTGFQPGADSGDAGDGCWFTASNPAGSNGADDVDNGEVVLLSPTFDLTGLANPRLSYQRWFAHDRVGEDPGDFFTVEASDDGGSLWQTVELLGTNDNAPNWTTVTADLGAIIALTNNVRFRVRVADGTAIANLVEAAFDDFKITEAECDTTPPCFVPPTFAGLVQLDSGPDCAETTLGWQAATSNCVNAAISYNVYRSTDPAFTPDQTNLVAGSLAGLGIVDSLLAPGSDYTYVVRAFDSRSGEETNLAKLTVTAPTAPDTKPPQFAGLALATSGSSCGETALSWPPALESCSTPVTYNVYRATSAGFVPDATTLIGRTTGTSLIDAGVPPGSDVYYVVRAEDGAGLEDSNSSQALVEATVLELEISREEFESGAAGWARSGLNDAATGLWELGDPVGTAAQPDTCPSGTSCWATGLSGPGLGDNDIDGGTTTLLSAPFNLVGLSEPAVRYARYYSNNTGQAPNSDTWLVEISNDDGANWTTLESTTLSDENFVFTDVNAPLTGIIDPSPQMRLRFTASDLGTGSLVEAVVDDFRVVDLAGGCDGCPTPPGVATILVTLDGADVVLDWTADPVSAERFKVYALEGPTFGEARLTGSSAAKTFRQIGGALLPGLSAFRVSAVDECGQEGPLM